MNASKLMEITIAHENKIEDILKLCEQEAKSGKSELVIFTFLRTEVVSELGLLGIRVQKKEAPLGDTVYVISWH